jgi:hypothetical protein
MTIEEKIDHLLFTRLACARFLADLTHNFVPQPSWQQGPACLRPDRAGQIRFRRSRPAALGIEDVGPKSIILAPLKGWGVTA